MKTSLLRMWVLSQTGLSQLWLKTRFCSPRTSGDDSNQLFETQPWPNWISQTPFLICPRYCFYWIKRANQNCCSGFWEGLHFLILMIIRWLVIRQQMLHCGFSLSLSFSCISSFFSIHVLPFCFSFFLSFCPPLSFSLNLGWKGHCYILLSLLHGGKWNGNVSRFCFCLSLPPSLLRRPPNQASEFPRPLYNCCTNHPIVQLFCCMFQGLVETPLVC